MIWCHGLVAEKLQYIFQDVILNLKLCFRCIELLSRLAWCYWHLKEFSKCEEIVKGAKRNGFCKVS